MGGLTIYLDAGPCDYIVDYGIGDKHRCNLPADEYDKQNLGRYCPAHLALIDSSKDGGKA